MAELETLDPDASTDDVLVALDRDGGVIVRDLLSPELLSRLNGELEPWIEGSPNGRDDFTGRQTTRTGALVARSPAAREVVMHPLALSVANGFLTPFTNKIQLHLTQIIRIRPDQGNQPLHRDRLAWGGYVPREIEPQLNTIWALTDFTTENGATRVVPGSHRWPDEQRAEPEQKAQAAMPAGSVLFYTGSVIHSGGENHSNADRVAANITYCLAWLRTEENQFLSCPPDIAKDLEPELQELLGYTMGNYALGYYSDPVHNHEANDILPPEFLLGRKPREAYGIIEG